MSDEEIGAGNCVEQIGVSIAHGRLVRVSNGEEVWQGTTCGVEHDGALRLNTTNGEMKLVRAGDVYSLR